MVPIYKGKVRRSETKDGAFSCPPNVDEHACRHSLLEMVEEDGYALRGYYQFLLHTNAANRKNKLKQVAGYKLLWDHVVGLPAMLYSGRTHWHEDIVARNRWEETGFKYPLHDAVLRNSPFCHMLLGNMRHGFTLGKAARKYLTAVDQDTIKEVLQNCDIVRGWEIFNEILPNMCKMFIRTEDLVRREICDKIIRPFDSGEEYDADTEEWSYPEEPIRYWEDLENTWPNSKYKDELDEWFRQEDLRDRVRTDRLLRIRRGN